MAILSPEVLQDLREICPGGVTQDVPLATYTQWRVGGLADVVVSPCSIDELANVRRLFFTRKVPHLAIGATTNLLFSDEGLRVPCIRVSGCLGAVEVRHTKVLAGAGVWVPLLARKLMQAGLTGAEHICGIPGTLGGLIYMNGGSQRKGIGSLLQRIESINIKGERVSRMVAMTDFGYRTSIFQENEEIITLAQLSLAEDSPRKIRRRMLEILRDRRLKFPRKQPNCGSVFKSSSEMFEQVGPPGRVIESLGLKGLRRGGAVVSLNHANFIVNAGGAKARDILELIAIVGEAVRQHTGFSMEAEVQYVTPFGISIPADQVNQR